MSGPASTRPARVPRPRFFAAILLVAFASAAFAISFRVAVEQVFAHAFRARDVLEAFRGLPWWARLVVPALGGLMAGGLSVIAARAEGGHGVGDVMEAVVLGGRKISISATVLKALGSFAAISTGGSIGREGPLILFGGAVGSRLGEAFGIRAEWRRRALVAAGVAAGFAAAYNTPFAAILFVVEIVIGVVALEILLPAALAAAISTAVTRAVIGPGPIYGQHAFQLRSNLELVVHLGLGLLAGVAGVVFMQLLARAERAFTGLPVQRPVRAAIGGAAVGLVAIVLPQVTGNGYEAIALLLRGELAIGLVAILLVAKPIATAASVGSGSPGGVFTPSLFLGAALGAVVAGLAAHALPGLAPVGAYALVGMAAVVAATTHAPLMAAVFVFEVSGDYAIVVPLIVATSSATALARLLRPSSIYMDELARRGVSWELVLHRREIPRDDDDG